MSDSEDDHPLGASAVTDSRTTMSVDESDSPVRSTSSNIKLFFTELLVYFLLDHRISVTCVHLLLSGFVTSSNSCICLTCHMLSSHYAMQVKRKSLLLKRKAVFTSESEDDVPLSSFTMKQTTVNGANGNANASQSREKGPPNGSQRQPKQSDNKARLARKRAKRSYASSDEEEKELKAEETSEDDVPLATPRKHISKSTNGRNKAKAKVKEESDDDMEVDNGSKKPAKSKGKEKASTAKKKDNMNGEIRSPKKKKKEEDEEEIFRWWDVPADVEGDGSVKWKTLEHNGVLFPPLYTPLPPDVKMKYKGKFLVMFKHKFNVLQGKPVDLPPESEEVAGFFGAMLNTEHAENSTFQKNFFHDFKVILQDYPPVRIGRILIIIHVEPTSTSSREMGYR